MRLVVNERYRIPCSTRRHSLNWTAKAWVYKFKPFWCPLSWPLFRNVSSVCVSNHTGGIFSLRQGAKWWNTSNSTSLGDMHNLFLVSIGRSLMPTAKWCNARHDRQLEANIPLFSNCVIWASGKSRHSGLLFLGNYTSLISKCRTRLFHSFRVILQTERSAFQTLNRAVHPESDICRFHCRPVHGIWRHHDPYLIYCIFSKFYTCSRGGNIYYKKGLEKGYVVARGINNNDPRRSSCRGGWLIYICNWASILSIREKFVLNFTISFPYITIMYIQSEISASMFSIYWWRRWTSSAQVMSPEVIRCISRMSTICAYEFWLLLSPDAANIAYMLLGRFPPTVGKYRKRAVFSWRFSSHFGKLFLLK